MLHQREGAQLLGQVTASDRSFPASLQQREPPHIAELPRPGKQQREPGCFATSGVSSLSLKQTQQAHLPSTPTCTKVLAAWSASASPLQPVPWVLWASRPMIGLDGFTHAHLAGIGNLGPVSCFPGLSCEPPDSRAVRSIQREEKGKGSSKPLFREADNSRDND